MDAYMRCGFLAVTLLSAYHAQADDQVVDFKVKTAGGLSIESEDKAYMFALGGRIQLDFNNYDGVMNADSSGERASDLFVRRARLVASGTIASDWGFKTEFNINEDGGGDITDVYIKYTGFGRHVQIRAGHQREPFGLEPLTSSKNISLIERSAATEAFDVGRSMGIQLNGYGGQWSYAAGFFEASQDENDDIEFAYTGRVTALPWVDDRFLLYIGGGLRISDGDVDEIDARPGIRQVDGSDRISSGAVAGDESTVFNVEAAAVIGAAHLSAEYFEGDIEAFNGANDTSVNGYYVQGGWFLSGESRPYDRKTGAFGKVKPLAASGAWELLGRYDVLNLADNDVGNDATVVTLGINWYANAHVRAGINLVQTEYDTSINQEDSGTGISGRLQLVF